MGLQDFTRFCIENLAELTRIFKLVPRWDPVGQQVMQPPQHLDYKLLQKEAEELAGGDTATAKELAHVLAKLQGHGVSGVTFP